jgi:hypothetical protein
MRPWSQIDYDKGPVSKLIITPTGFESGREKHPEADFSCWKLH